MSKGVGELVAGIAVVTAAVALTALGVGLPLDGILFSLGTSLVMGGIGSMLTKATGVTTTLRNPVKDWDIVYGECQVNGTTIFLEETGQNNSFLHMIVVVAAHPVESIGNNYGTTFDGVFLNNKRVLFQPAGGNPLIGDSQATGQTTRNIATISRVNDVVTVTMTGPMPLAAGDDIQIQHVTVDDTVNGDWTIQASPSQTVFSFICGGLPFSVNSQGTASTLFANWGDNIHVEYALGQQSATNPPFPGLLQSGEMGSDGQWTNEHLLLGKSAVYIRFRWTDKGMFSNGLPNLTFRIRGKSNIFDPRTNTTGYTANAALCIADYLSNTRWGFKAAYGTEIPYEQLTADSNICDEQVLCADGTYENRYECNGTFDVGVGRGTILQNMLTSCQGRLTYSQGQFAINAAAWQGSSFNFARTSIGNGLGTNLVVPPLGRVTYFQLNWTDLYGGFPTYTAGYTEVCFDGVGGATIKWLGKGPVTIYFNDYGYNNVPLVGDDLGIVGPVSLGSGFVPGESLVMQIFPESSHNPASTYNTGPASTNRDGALHARISAAYYTPETTYVPDFDPSVLGIHNMATGPYQWKPKLSSRDLYNAVKGKFTCVANKWQTSDFPYYAQDQLHGYTNGPEADNYDINLAADGGDRRYLETQYPFTTSVTCCQRLAKIALMRLRQQGRATFAWNMSAYQLALLDVGTLTLPALNWSNKLLEVTAHRLTMNKVSSGGEDATVLGCEVELQETDPSVYEWSPSEELSFASFGQQGTSISGSLPGSSASTPGQPTGLTLQSGPTVSVVGADGIARSGLLASWTAPVDGFVNQVIVQYQVVGATSWMSLANVPVSTTSAYIANVTDGQSYNVQIASQNVQGAVSAFIEAGPCLVSGTASVVAPTSISTSGATSGEILYFNGTVWGPEAMPGGFTVSVNNTPTGITGLSSGGGSSSAYPFVNLIAPPTTGWTWANQGTSTEALANSVLSMNATGTGSDQLRFYSQALPTATPWTVIAAFIPGHGQWNGGEGYYSEGIAVSDGTKYRTFWVSYVSSASATSSDVPGLNVQGYDSVTAYNGGQNIILRNLPALPITWLKIHDDGTTRSYSISVDPTNIGWTLLGTEAHTNYLVPTQAGIVMDLYGSGLNGVTVQSVPWISWQILNA